MAKLKRRMLFSEKEKLAVKYEQWCNQIDEKLNNCRIKREDVVTVITFLQKEGFAKQSDTIKAFVDEINLAECEMFHKAHDARDSCEEELNKAKSLSDFESERVWGEKRECDGKMIALQDLMTKIDELAKEYGVGVEE